jgi:Cu+-exporting ATPase
MCPLIDHGQSLALSEQVWWATEAVFPRDPYCGRVLHHEMIMASYEYIGRTYYFCSFECHAAFVRDPEMHVVRLAHDGN